MKNRFFIVTLSCACISLIGCSGQSFPGSQYFPGKSSRPVPLKPLKPVANKINVVKSWEIKTGSPAGSYKIHPYIHNQTVYISSGSTASAFNKTSAKLKWTSKIGEIVSAGVNGGTSRSIQQIFIGTSNGDAIALNADSGKILWIERLGSEVLTVSSAKDNRVVFRTIDGKLHGLNSQTGEIIWQQSQRTPALSLYGASVPLVLGNYVISGFDNGKIAAYSLQTGAPAWESTIAEPRGQSELERMVDIDGKIKILGKALFANSLNGNEAGIKVENGQLAWAKVFSSATGNDADPQGLYSSDMDGNVWKLQPQTGNPVWKMDDLKRREPTTPILFNSALLVVGDKQGNLHWINSTSGQFVARSQGDPNGYAVAPEINENAVYTFGKSGILSKIQIR